MDIFVLLPTNIIKNSEKHPFLSYSINYLCLKHLFPDDSALDSNEFESVKNLNFISYP